ncbi:DUF2550 family protein [Flaviflexus massiliensis]|uniref:DUF2550 family protein n=1 Tax=Flaviflexus massiliensis TaxID=1522309 RepID=UPI0006D56310|nr:DUF2550 family protein [Flaviflexus massiliensis]
MDAPAIALSVIVALLVVAGAFAIWAMIRTRALFRRVGSFPAAISVPDSNQWRSGVAIFGAEYLRWYKTGSISTKPVLAFSRNRLNVIDYHQRNEATGTVVVHFECNGQHWLWAMTNDSAAGVVSWMDGASPVEEPTGI